MNFERFDTLFDGERSTVLVKMAADAIEKDIKAQRRRISRSKYNAWIHAAHRLSNANALRYGHAIGNKIIEGKPLDKGNAYIRGSDLAKIVYYCFYNEGLLEWHHLKTLVTNKAEELIELIDVKPLDSSNISEQVSVAVGDVNFGTNGFAAELRRLADQIEPLETIKNELRITAERQGLTIVNQSNVIMIQNEELQKQKELLANLKGAIDRLRSAIKAEKNEKKKDEMSEELQKLDNILDGIK